MNSSTTKSASAACPANKKVLSGGATIHSELGTLTYGIAIVSSLAFAGAWYVTAQEMIPTDVNWRVRVQVICGIASYD